MFGEQAIFVLPVAKVIQSHLGQMTVWREKKVRIARISRGKRP